MYDFAKVRLALFAFFIVSPAIVHANPAIPLFNSAAAARSYGELMEQSGQLQAAGLAYVREAALRDSLGDPQGGEVERLRGRRLLTDLALAVPAATAPPANPAKFEPARGCLLGVLDRSFGLDAGEFEQRVGHPVAVVFDYLDYGEPFPMNWAREETESGHAIQIAWEPNHGLADVRDDDYLENWAHDAADSHAEIFLRFGGEMNGDWTAWGRQPEAYKAAFRLVHDVMARYAPNVAMVWAPNAVPVAGVDAYYPGDNYVDWVGISLYLVRYYDDDLSRPAWQDHPDAFIEPFYRKYAGRKPLCLVECGISRRSRVENADADPFAAARIEDLFDSARVRYPRLKMICWFDHNNLESSRAGRRLNDYSLPAGSLALQAYQTATADPYFLQSPATDLLTGYQRIDGALPSGYEGAVVGSLSTYALDSALVVTQGSKTVRVSRPYAFQVSGEEPVSVEVKDKQGRVAGKVRLSVPTQSTGASGTL